MPDSITSFSLERSTDGQNWVLIQTLPGTPQPGCAGGQLPFCFTDSSPPQNAYYRLTGHTQLGFDIPYNTVQASLCTDTVPPTGQITSPAPNSTVTGTINISANAQDPNGLQRVEFWLQSIGSLFMVKSVPASGTSVTVNTTLDTSLYLNGQTLLAMKPYDSCGNAVFANYIYLDFNNVNLDPATLAWDFDIGKSNLGSNASVVDIKNDSAGNSYVVGRFSGTVNFSGVVRTAGNVSIFLLKFDPSGNQTMIRTYSGTRNVIPASICLDSAGNIGMTGQFLGTIDFGAGPITSDGGNDQETTFVAKFNGAGDCAWSLKFGGVINGGVSIVSDASNSFFVIGNYLQTCNPGGGNISGQGQQVYLAKYLSAGAFAWVNNIGGASTDFASDVSIDSAGNAVICGYTSGTIDFGQGEQNHGGSDFFVAKYLGSTGALVWGHLIGNANDDAAYTLTTKGTDIFVAGVFKGLLSFGIDANGIAVTASAPLNQGMFILKMDTTSKPVWAKAVGGNSSIGGNTVPKGIEVDSDGKIVISGSATGEVDFGDGTITAGSGNMFLMKLRPTNGFLWAKRFVGTGSNIMNAISIDPNRNIAAGGFLIGSVNLDPQHTLSSVSPVTQDAFLVKFSP